MDKVAMPGGKVSGLGEAGAEGADRGAQGGAGDVRHPARGHAAAAADVNRGLHSRPLKRRNRSSVSLFGPEHKSAAPEGAALLFHLDILPLLVL